MISGACKMMKVLVADGDDATRQTLRTPLEAACKEVIVAKDGPEAATLYAKNRPDFCLIELTLPKFNGLQMLKKIKEADPEAVIMLLASRAEPKYLAEAIFLGADGFLPKPITSETLDSAINRIVRKVIVRAQQNKNRKITDLYRTALDSTDAVTVLNAQGVIIHVNEVQLQLSGREKTELIGKPHMLLRNQSGNKILQAIWDTVHAQKTWHGKIKDKNKAGEALHIEVTITPVVREEKIQEFVLVSKDITEEENERQQREKRIIHSQSKAISEARKKEAELNNKMNELFMEHERMAEQVEILEKEKNKFQHKAEYMVQKVQELSFMVSFTRIGASEVHRAKRYNRALSVVVMGIDHLASISGNLDAEYMTDKLLAAYRKHIADTIRVCDYFVMNDEDNTFTVLLTETDLAGSKGFINRISGVLEKNFRKFHNHVITTSFGVTQLKEEDDDDFAALVMRAKEAYFEASSRGRGNIKEVA